MIIKEEITFNGINLLHFFSDSGKMIQSSDNKKYSDAIESLDTLVTYTEIDENAPITLTQSMIASQTWQEQNKDIYEVRADEHGNLIAEMIYDA